MPPIMIRNHDADTAPVAVVEPDAFGTPGVLDRLGAHMTRLVTDEDGMSTAEYAIGTIAAAAFGAILYTVVTGDNIVSALTGIIGKALNTSVG